MQRTLQILHDWETPLIVLFWYYVLAAIATCLISTRCSRRRATNPSRYRMIFAAAVALVFTPSVITDFWLFMLSRTRDCRIPFLTAPHIHVSSPSHRRVGLLRPPYGPRLLPIVCALTVARKASPREDANRLTNR